MIHTRSQNVRWGRNADLSGKQTLSPNCDPSEYQPESHHDSERSREPKPTKHQLRNDCKLTALHGYFRVTDEELPIEGGEIAIQRLVQLQKKDSTCISIMEQVRDQTTSEFHQRNDDVYS